MTLSYVGAGTVPSTGPTQGIENWKSYVSVAGQAASTSARWGIRNIRGGEHPVGARRRASMGLALRQPRPRPSGGRRSDGVHHRTSRAARHPGHPRLRRLPDLAVEPRRLGTGVEAAEARQRHGRELGLVAALRGPSGLRAAHAEVAAVLADGGVAGRPRRSRRGDRRATRSRRFVRMTRAPRSGSSRKCWRSGVLPVEDRREVRAAHGCRGGGMAEGARATQRRPARRRVRRRAPTPPLPRRMPAWPPCRRQPDETSSERIDRSGARMAGTFVCPPSRVRQYVAHRMSELGTTSNSNFFALPLTPPSSSKRCLASVRTEIDRPVHSWACPLRLWRPRTALTIRPGPRLETCCRHHGDVEDAVGGSRVRERFHPAFQGADVADEDAARGSFEHSLVVDVDAHLERLARRCACFTPARR